MDNPHSTAREHHCSSEIVSIYMIIKKKKKKKVLPVSVLTLISEDSNMSKFFKSWTYIFKII